ncbi:hydrogenase maturation nickel metallochaperone HypA [Candidatus Methylospira mobilis]|uniref:Hydrogenase maturation factor HypA n=1 Tax=Candidatus Methylospira mobilis TaxID=1808979 RepID=A0A5Q0BLT4_9GAMM|nr:hydrogenase maturation nickel metallochaperone HypA [Candidatus Methylospira mobilis]QFY44793.1 hydrogenase maturation nickel metallochaperone HypA [Candidatus Methylospira mobilis]WNV05666.1 hydrogenase maturation nickel metallochaperone HypA [Candidatus Methylospira mobilis]
MHELSLCQGIIDIIDAQAREQRFTRVRKVCLAIGPMAGVDPEALQFGFEFLRKDGPAEQAVLEITETPGTAWCFECSRQVSVGNYQAPCPLCDGHQLQITGGEELKITALEVE